MRRHQRALAWRGHGPCIVRRIALLVGLSLVVAACGNGAQLDTSEPWDLVWYSDSTGWGVAELWAARIADEFDVEVRVHDHAEGDLAAIEILSSLGLTPDGRSAEVFGRLWDTRPEVAGAEIVVVYGNPIGANTTDDLEQCVTTSAVPRDPPTHYSDADFAPYRQVLESIYEQVFALVGDRPVIVRAIDSYNPVIAPQELAGVKDECIEAWEAWSANIRAAAERFDVPMISMYDVFNGPDHDEDPRAKGYIGYDGQHTIAEGKQAMMTALHEAGYEPIGR